MYPCIHRYKAQFCLGSFQFDVDWFFHAAFKLEKDVKESIYVKLTQTIVKQRRWFTTLLKVSLQSCTEFPPQTAYRGHIMLIVFLPLLYVKVCKWKSHWKGGYCPPQETLLLHSLKQLVWSRAATSVTHVRRYVTAVIQIYIFTYVL